MANKPKTGEAVVKELARKDFNKQCFDCGRGVSRSYQHIHIRTHTHIHALHSALHTCRPMQMRLHTSSRSASTATDLFVLPSVLCWWRCCSLYCRCRASLPVCQGPQQNVNLTLNTFVCTQCSGLLSASSEHTLVCTRPPAALSRPSLLPSLCAVCVTVLQSQLQPRAEDHQHVHVQAG